MNTSRAVTVRKLFIRCVGRPVLILSTIVLGCGHSATSGRLTAPRVDQSLITSAELQSRDYTNLYDAVQALRGNWMRVRPSDSFSSPSVIQVYLDNQRIGGVEQLRSLAPRMVFSVRYFDGIQATAKWGLDHAAGAISVTTLR